MEHITDKRVNPKYKTPQIISVVLTGFLLRVQSFNRTAISAQTLKTGSTRHFRVPFSMHQIRNYFMVLHTNISFDIIRVKGR